MTEIDRQILKARPPVKEIFPVVHWLTIGFIAVDLLVIAAGLIFWEPTVYAWIAPNDFMLHIVWPALFAGNGLLLVLGLYRKLHEKLKSMMMVDLALKAGWAMALLLRIEDGGTYLVAGLFLGLCLLQAILIVFYLPPEKVDNEGLI